MSYPFRVDWSQIKNSWPAESRLVLLDQRAIMLLLSILPRFRWKASYGYQPQALTDWNDIQDLINETEWELGAAMPLSQIIPLIDEIEDLLRNLNTAANCCDKPDVTGGDGYTTPVEDGVGDVPQSVIDAGYATGVSDWAGFDDYKCMASHLMVQNMQWQVGQLSEHVGLDGLIVGGIGTILAIIGSIVAAVATGGVSILVEILAMAGAAGTIWTTIAAGGIELLDDLADDLETNYDALVCAMYQADGSAGAVTALKAAIDANFNAAQAVLLKNLNLDVQVKALYEGRYDQTSIAEAMAGQGLDPADYTCNCAIQADAYRLFDWNDYTAQGWACYYGCGDARIDFVNANFRYDHSQHPNVSRVGIDYNDLYKPEIPNNEAKLYRVELDYMWEDDGAYWQATDNWQLQILIPSSYYNLISQNFGDPNTTRNQWYHVVLEVADFPQQVQDGIVGVNITDTMRFRLDMPNHHGGCRMRFDNLEVWFNQDVS